MPTGALAAPGAERSAGRTTASRAAQRQAARTKTCSAVAFASESSGDANSGKVYALGKPPGPWQTRFGSGAAPHAARVPCGVAACSTTRQAAGSRLRGRSIKAPMGNDIPGGSPLAGIKVMVIDDSNTIRRSAEIFLLQAGCTVILAEDGFDALAKIADHQPDLVFVDIMMPRLDGYQTCALIKKNSRFHAMPVIMLSSKDGLFDRARGRMVGSDQYLTKPFTKESLLKAVAAHVRAVAA
jgi:twitching motility two-component system response regulator PilG